MASLSDKDMVPLYTDDSLPTIPDPVTPSGPSGGPSRRGSSYASRFMPTPSPTQPQPRIPIPHSKKPANDKSDSVGDATTATNPMANPKTKPKVSLDGHEPVSTPDLIFAQSEDEAYAETRTSKKSLTATLPLSQRDKSKSALGSCAIPLLGLSARPEEVVAGTGSSTSPSITVVPTSRARDVVFGPIDPIPIPKTNPDPPQLALTPPPIQPPAIIPDAETMMTHKSPTLPPSQRDKPEPISGSSPATPSSSFFRPAVLDTTIQSPPSELIASGLPLDLLPNPPIERSRVPDSPQTPSISITDLALSETTKTRSQSHNPDVDAGVGQVGISRDIPLKDMAASSEERLVLPPLGPPSPILELIFPSPHSPTPHCQLQLQPTPPPTLTPPLQQKPQPTRPTALCCCAEHHCAAARQHCIEFRASHPCLCGCLVCLLGCLECLSGCWSFFSRGCLECRWHK